MDAMASLSEDGQLLTFHRRMVQELIEADGLCVMAAGELWSATLALYQILCLRISTYCRVFTIM